MPAAGADPLPPMMMMMTLIKPLLRILLACLGTLLGVLATASSSAQVPAAIRQITEIRLPAIRVDKASATEVFSFIGHKVREFDPYPDPAMRGISFLSTGEISPQARVINYQRKNIAVGTVLQDLADLYDVEIHITSVGAVMCPRGVPPFPNIKEAKGVIYVSYKPAPAKAGQ